MTIVEHLNYTIEQIPPTQDIYCLNISKHLLPSQHAADMCPVQVARDLHRVANGKSALLVIYHG